MSPNRVATAALSIWLACGVTLVGAPPRAHAGAGEADGAADGTTSTAKQHYYKGEKLFALGRFRDALAAYEAAFEVDPLPELLFNIGQCHRNLGDYRSAVFSFRKYLRLRPAAPNR